MVMTAKKVQVPQETELRRICRDSTRRWVSVMLVDWRGMNHTPWLWLGETSLERPGSGTGKTWWLQAGLGPRRRKNEGVPTDREHDNAWACRLPLIGVELESIRYHHTVISAWVGTDPTDFHVPLPGYDPRRHPDAVVCAEKSCLEIPPEDGGGSHIIVPEGFYVPPFEEELFQAVRGQRVEITFFPGADNG